MAYVVLPAYDDIGNEDMLQRAGEAANRALALDSQNVQALTASAYSETLQYRNVSAEKYFARAIAADSSFATAHFWHCCICRNIGTTRRLRKFCARDPWSPHHSSSTRP